MEVLLIESQEKLTTQVSAYIFSLYYLHSKIGKIKAFLIHVSYPQVATLLPRNFILVYKISFNILLYQDISRNLEMAGCPSKENLWTVRVINEYYVYCFSQVEL